MEDFGFKYKIGDIVILKVAAEEARARCAEGEQASPYRGMIVVRLLDECSGGVQRHYHVAFSNATTTHNEIELAAAADFDLPAEFARAYAVQKKRRDEPDRPWKEVLDGIRRVGGSDE
jgi:hypothetical protein